MKALFKTAKSTCFECEARTCFLLFFDDGEEKGMICKEMEGHSDDMLYRGIADEI